MGKPIAGMNTFPYNKDGYHVYVVRSDGMDDEHLMAEMFIIRQRSINEFDLSDGKTIYKKMKLVGLGIDGFPLNPLNNELDVGRLLPKNSFCVRYIKEQNPIGFIIRFMTHKVTLQNGLQYPHMDFDDDVIPPEDVYITGLKSLNSIYTTSLRNNNISKSIYNYISFFPSYAKTDFVFNCNDDQVLKITKEGVMSVLSGGDINITVTEKHTGLSTSFRVIINEEELQDIKLSVVGIRNNNIEFKVEMIPESLTGKIMYSASTSPTCLMSGHERVNNEYISMFQYDGIASTISCGLKKPFDEGLVLDDGEDLSLYVYAKDYSKSKSITHKFIKSNLRSIDIGLKEEYNVSTMYNHSFVVIDVRYLPSHNNDSDYYINWTDDSIQVVDDLDTVPEYKTFTGKRDGFIYMKCQNKDQSVPIVLSYNDADGNYIEKQYTINIKGN